MLVKILDFFRNLPKKKCVECGKEINEQHESYSNRCEKCSSIS